MFEGPDRAARIVLNGREAGRHNDAFFPCRVSVSGALRQGRNVLVVHLESGLLGAAGKPIQGYLYFGSPRVKRVWLRKVQCQFEWDWAARLLNVGIFQPARLEWTAATVRAGQLVPLPELSADLARGTVRVRQFIERIFPTPAEPFWRNIRWITAGTGTSPSQSEFRKGRVSIDRQQ